MSLAIIFVLSIGGFILTRRASENNVESNNPNGQDEKPDINFEPPTQEEIAETDRRKEEIANGTVQGNDQKKKVTPVITAVSQDELSAFVPGIVEDGGVCSATFTQDKSSFTKQSDGFSNATTTNCKTLDLRDSDFPKKGLWNVFVRYTSSGAEGESSQLSFEVK